LVLCAASPSWAGPLDADAPSAVATTLPAVEPDPDVARVLGEEPGTAVPREIEPEDRPGAVIKTIVGLLSLLGLAYVGGHRRILEWERRLGVSQVVVAGLPFVLLGMIARMPSIGILTDPVLTELSPLLRIALGSVGFVTGFRFDARRFERLPPGVGRVVLLSTLVPAILVTFATAPFLLHFSGIPWSVAIGDPVFVRDALILATAGAMTARSATWRFENEGTSTTASQVVRAEELAGVLGLALVAAVFRPDDVGGAWSLPGMGWFLLTLGLGTVFGLLFYVIFHEARDVPSFIVVTIGAISFAAGAAGYLHLSSVAVAFVSGVLLANFPGEFRDRLRDVLNDVERPIYLLSLVVIGALWQVDDPRGWMLMPVFMAARLIGKWLAARWMARMDDVPLSAAESRGLAISPIGSLAVAIVVSAQLLYPGGAISLIVSAVIGGSILTEIFVQLAGRSATRADAAAGT
jgi:Kef-type K+ transport system membrane component KefB